jgi:hypothetical protein
MQHLGGKPEGFESGNFLRKDYLNFMLINKLSCTVKMHSKPGGEWENSVRSKHKLCFIKKMA